MYYVYEWFVVETGEIIYVGKGTGRRYKVRKHNKFFNEIISRLKCSSRIIKEFQTEKEAFSYEFERINELKSMGQCVCNIYNGGFGGTTEWWTDERRKEYSDKNVMKSEKQRQRMSEKNPMKNSKTVISVVAQKQRAVVIGSEEFPSVKAAMQHFRVPFETIQRWCKKGIKPDGTKCRYKNEPQQDYNGRYNKGSCKAVIYNNNRYESATDLAKELGINQTTVSRWARRGFATDGTPCKYE